MIIEPVTIHRLKNQLAIILGFCELLLADLAADDPRRADVLQIQKAGQTALADLPQMAAHDVSELGAERRRE
jgi:hypothetical protein